MDVTVNTHQPTTIPRKETACSDTIKAGIETLVIHGMISDAEAEEFCAQTGTEWYTPIISNSPGNIPQLTVTVPPKSDHGPMTPPPARNITSFPMRVAAPSAFQTVFPPPPDFGETIQSKVTNEPKA